MKFFSAALLVALFCASAPGVLSIEKLSYEEVAAVTTPASVGVQLKKYNSQIQCLGKVLDKVDNENINKVKAESIKTINNILDVELVNCMKIENAQEQLTCKTDIVKKAVDIISETTTKIVLGSDWSIVKDVYSKISKECLSPVSFGLTLFKNGDLKLLDVFPELFESAGHVLADVLKSNGLEQLVTENHPQFEENVAKWLKCTQKNRFTKLPCHQSAGGATDKFFNQYVNKVGDIDPKIVDKFFVQCAKRSFNA